MIENVALAIFRAARVKDACINQITMVSVKSVQVLAHAVRRRSDVCCNLIMIENAALVRMLAHAARIRKAVCFNQTTLETVMSALWSVLDARRRSDAVVLLVTMVSAFTA